MIDKIGKITVNLAIVTVIAAAATAVMNSGSRFWIDRFVKKVMER